jgi:hypothetical protein
MCISLSLLHLGNPALKFCRASSIFVHASLFLQHTNINTRLLVEYLLRGMSF